MQACRHTGHTFSSAVKSSKTSSQDKSTAAAVQLAKMSQTSTSGPQLGDVLRACTCTNLVYPTRSLLGVQAPVRTIVVFGADGQRWPKASHLLDASLAYLSMSDTVAAVRRLLQ